MHITEYLELDGSLSSFLTAYPDGAAPQTRDILSIDAHEEGTRLTEIPNWITTEMPEGVDGHDVGESPCVSAESNPNRILLFYTTDRPTGKLNRGRGWQQII